MQKTNKNKNEINTVTKPPNDENIVHQDAMTREQNLAGFSKGFAGRFVKCGSWLFITLCVLYRGRCAYCPFTLLKKKKSDLCDIKYELCYLSLGQMVGGGTNVEDSVA